jgi:hypothetical protein
LSSAEESKVWAKHHKRMAYRVSREKRLDIWWLCTEQEVEKLRAKKHEEQYSIGLMRIEEDGVGSLL